jgi:hypothetical protein
MKRMFWLSMMLLANAALAADVVDYGNLAASARSVDASSRQTLGIGIRALSLLLKASPRSFQPEWALKKNGDVELLDELDAKGYVVVTRTSGLPDGTDADVVYVNYVATEKGKAVVSAIMSGPSK